MRHLVFILLLVACSIAEIRLTCAKPRVKWTAEVTLAYVSWLALVVVSMIWPDWDRAMPVMGGLAFAIGNGLVIAARHVNPYFTPNLQTSPVIVSAGVYRYCKHPGYLGMAVAACGAWLYFYSWQAVYPLAAYHAIILTRVWRERAVING